MAFNYAAMTPEQQAQFKSALSQNTDFIAAVEANQAPAEAPDFLTELTRVNDEYNAATDVRNQTIQSGGAVSYNPFETNTYDTLAPSTYSEVEARDDILNLLNDNGYTSAEDLKTSVSGSHNDSYMNLGIGNALYDDKSSGFEPRGGDSRDVNIEDWYDREVGGSNLIETGREPGLFSGGGWDAIAAAAAPFTYGLSTAALTGARDLSGDTQHGDQWGDAAVSIAANTLLPKLTDYLGEAAIGGETLQTVAEEQAAFEAYQAAQQGSNIIDYADLGLSPLPNALPFAEVAAGAPSLTDAARAAYEADMSGVISNIVSGGGGVVDGYNPAGPDLWDVLGSFNDAYQSRGNEQGNPTVPPNQDQSTGGLSKEEADGGGGGGGGNNSEAPTTAPPPAQTWAEMSGGISSQERLIRSLLNMREHLSLRWGIGIAYLGTQMMVGMQLP